MNMRGIQAAMLLAAVLGMSAVHAQQPAADADARHLELRKLKTTMEEALNKRDLDALIANVDEHVVFTTMNDDVALGKEGVRQYFKKMMEGPDRVVDSVTTEFVPDGPSFFHGDDEAVAYGSTNDHYVLKNGQKFDIHARWTATLNRKDGHWLVSAFHYSANMFDNPILRAQRRYLILIGAGAAVALALLGFLLGRRRSRPAAAS
jgi:uncharacterized protein (TIGR02246 family)